MRSKFFNLIEKLFSFSFSYLLKFVYIWKISEKNFFQTLEKIFKFISKTNPLSLSKYITLPLQAQIILSQLEDRLFFEYKEYTPFLYIPNQEKPFLKKSLVRRNRLIKYTQGENNFSFSKYNHINNVLPFWTFPKQLTLFGFQTPLYILSHSFLDFWKDFKTSFSFLTLLKTYFFSSLLLFRKTVGAGLFYLKGLFIMFFIDACLTDDEPLWEPIEWSLVQSWILFIFLFAWIAENLITSAYGSYTGRDKRVWFAWYKTFWLIELWYALSLGLAALFVITPFYNELAYTTPFIVSWWTWYSRVFFCKFVTLYSIVLYVAYFLQINIRFLHWKKLLYCTIVINIFLSYLLYIHFFMSFFGYLTNPNWYLKNRLVDYIQLSHEPHRWGWGVTKPVKRDHFLQHRSTSLIWFKNDGPFASAFLFLHVYFFLCLFFLYIFWLTLMRRAIATHEFSFTFTVFCISGLKQFFYFFGLFYILIIFSFVINYWRTPIENHWLLLTDSWIWTFFSLCKDLFNIY